MAELSHRSCESIHDEFKIKYYKTTHELIDRPENLNFYETQLHSINNSPFKDVEILEFDFNTEVIDK